MLKKQFCIILNIQFIHFLTSIKIACELQCRIHYCISPSKMNLFIVEFQQWVLIMAKCFLSLVAFLDRPTATLFLPANNNGQHLQPLNRFPLSFGHPGIGKSPAIETILSALHKIDCISKDTLFNSTPSSGLVKTLSKQGKGFIVVPELYDKIFQTSCWKMTKTHFRGCSVAV